MLYLLRLPCPDNECSFYSTRPKTVTNVAMLVLTSVMYSIASVHMVLRLQDAEPFPTCRTLHCVFVLRLLEQYFSTVNVRCTHAFPARYLTGSVHIRGCDRRLARMGHLGPFEPCPCRPCRFSLDNCRRRYCRTHPRNAYSATHFDPKPRRVRAGVPPCGCHAYRRSCTDSMHESPRHRAHQLPYLVGFAFR